MATVSASMATGSSYLDDQKSRVNVQTEGHTLRPPTGWNGPEEIEAFGSTPSHSPSWSPARKEMPECPETQYCLKIQVTLTKDGEMAPPPPHVWQAPMVEDMLWDGKLGLTEAVVTGPSQAILFYRRWSLGEGLNLGEVHDATITLSGAISWVGKQAQLWAKPVSLGKGRQLIGQAITKWCIKPRGPGCPCSILPASPAFSFHSQDEFPWWERLPTVAEWLEVPGHNCQMMHHDRGWEVQCSQEHSYRQWDLWATPPPLSSPSPDCRLESDQSSVSTSSSVLSRCDRSGGSRHSHLGWCHRELGGHMKNNLPVFKDEDTKDTITYQSWHCDLTVYCCAGCWDCTLLPYAIHSLQC